jgi:STAS-like domain of unknown function (DUF4325)
MGMYTEELKKIIVVEIVGTDCCVAACDGRKLHDKISVALRESVKMEVSFAGISDLTPAFLNSAVGQLYGIFSIELIERSLFFTDISEEDEIILKRVIERVKTYSENACSFRKAFSDVLGGEDA